ncbi:MAG: hypothetical protein AAFX87_02930 [Bacteroidota bacterium]
MKLIALASLALLTLFSGTPDRVLEEDMVNGTWRRQKDRLVIEFTKVSTRKAGGTTTVQDPSDWVFPCSLPENPFYTKIQYKGNDRWSCHYVVVETESCVESYYRNGTITLLDENNMEIELPQFETLYLTRVSPRKN